MWRLRRYLWNLSVQVQICLRPRNSEVKARPRLSSSLNVSWNSQWCRSWISVQTGRLRCGLLLFIQWICMCTCIYINPVHVYRWTFVCLQQAWWHTEYGLGILPLPEYNWNLAIQFGVVWTNELSSLKWEEQFYWLFRRKMLSQVSQIHQLTVSSKK